MIYFSNVVDSCNKDVITQKTPDTNNSMKKDSPSTNQMEKLHHLLCSRELRSLQLPFDSVQALHELIQSAKVGGSIINEFVKEYRFKVVQAFLSAGIRLRKVEHPDIKSPLESKVLTIPSRSSLSQFNPTVLDEEKKRISTQINNRYLSIIFDGTSHQGEALAVIFRFMSQDLSVRQRLVLFILLQKAIMCW